VKGFDIIPRSDSHAFLLGKADVIARLLFHAGENIFFGVFDDNDDSSRRLDVIFGKDERFAKRMKDEFVVPRIGFEFTEDGVMFSADIIDFLPKPITDELVTDYWLEYSRS
jgi:hypothetical protein